LLERYQIPANIVFVGNGRPRFGTWLWSMGSLRFKGRRLWRAHNQKVFFRTIPITQPRKLQTNLLPPIVQFSRRSLRLNGPL